MLRYYCNVYEKNEGYLLRTDTAVPREHCLSVMKPYGVWAVISPFNFPLSLAAGMCYGGVADREHRRIQTNERSTIIRDKTLSGVYFRWRTRRSPEPADRPR